MFEQLSSSTLFPYTTLFRSIVDDVDIGAMAALREQLNAAAPRDQEAKPAYEFSLNDFIVRAWAMALQAIPAANARSEEHTSELQSHSDLVCRLLLEKKK